MTSVGVQVPEWAKPPPQQVCDFYRLARAFADEQPDRDVIDGWATAAGLVIDTGLSYDGAIAEMNRAVAARQRPESKAKAGAIADTFAWLVGLLSRPPFELPRRHPDGRVVTAEEAFDEARAASAAQWGPEERAAQRQKARKQAARWAALADVAAQG